MSLKCYSLVLFSALIASGFSSLGVKPWERDLLAREEMLMDPEEFRRISTLRRVIAELTPADAMQNLVTQLRKTQNNAEFLMSLKDVE